MSEVRVDFVVGGVAEIRRAFESVGQALERMAKQQGAAGQRVFQEGARTAKSRVSDEERTARDRVRLEDRAAKDKVAAYKRGDAEVARARASALREFDRDEREKTRSAERWVKERTKQQEAEARRAQHVREQFGNTIGRGVNRGVSAAVQGTRGLATTALNIMGGFSVADSIQGVARDRGRAADIANSGSHSGKSFSGADVHAAASAVATKEGFSTGEVLEGLGEFTAKTGDLQKGKELLGQLGEMASATGSRFQDLASAAAEVSASMPDASNGKVMETMRYLSGQGQLGAVEIKDLAKRASLVTASAGKFEGDKEGNIVTLGAIAQEAKQRGGAANAAEATTSVARFADDVAAHKDRFAKLGITTTKGGVLRDPRQIIQDTLAKTGGDVSAITKLFGTRSARGVQGFAEIYRNAGGGAAGKEAVDKEFDRLKGAMMSEAEVREKAIARRQESDRQFESAMNQLRDAVGTQLLPQLTGMVPAFRDLIPSIISVAKSGADLAKWFAANPFKGLGAIVGLSIAREVAAAQIGQLISKALSTSMGQGFAIATAAITIAQAGMTIIDQAAKEDVDVHSKSPVENSIAADQEAKQLQAKILTGKATPEDIERAQTLEKKLRQNITQNQNDLGNPGMVESLSMALPTTFENARNAVMGGGDAYGTDHTIRDSQDAKMRENVKAVKMEKESTELLAKAIADAIKSTIPIGPPRPPSAGGPTPADPSRHAPLASTARGGTK